MGSSRGGGVGGPRRKGEEVFLVSEEEAEHLRAGGDAHPIPRTLRTQSQVTCELLQAAESWVASGREGRGVHEGPAGCGRCPHRGRCCWDREKGTVGKRSPVPRDTCPRF